MTDQRELSLETGAEVALVLSLPGAEKYSVVSHRRALHHTLDAAMTEAGVNRGGWGRPCSGTPT